MDPHIGEFMARIRELEQRIEQEAQERRQQWQADFESRKVRFEAEVLAQQKRFRMGLMRYVLSADWRSVLSVPFIYPVIVPLLLLDVSVTVYQWVCFPLYRIPRVKRSHYFVFDPLAPGLFEFARKNQLRLLLVWQWPGGLCARGGGPHRAVLVPDQARPQGLAGAPALPRLCRLWRCRALP